MVGFRASHPANWRHEHYLIANSSVLYAQATIPGIILHEKTQFPILEYLDPSFHRSNPAAEMDDEPIRPRNSTIAGLLFCCCPVSDDEPSLLRPSWFQKVKRSNTGADAMDGDPHNWWRKGWNSVRRAGEWSESLMEDAGSCCSKPKLKCFVRRMKNDGKAICSSRPSRFQYDPLSYELNFDQGSRQGQDYQYQGSPLTAVKPGESLGSPE